MPLVVISILEKGKLDYMLCLISRLAEIFINIQRYLFSNNKENRVAINYHYFECV